MSLDLPNQLLNYQWSSDSFQGGRRNFVHFHGQLVFPSGGFEFSLSSMCPIQIRMLRLGSGYFNSWSQSVGINQVEGSALSVCAVCMEFSKINLNLP